MAGTVSKGLPPSAIEQLPRKRFEAIRLQDAAFEQDM
jgi:hypothetical protein